MFFYLLTWKWDKKGNPSPTMVTMDDDFNNQTSINNKESTQKNSKFNINQRSVDESHKTLGTYKNILGKEEDHIQYLTKKSNEIGQLANKAQFNRRQARLAFSTCYVPSINYSLSSMCLSEKIINKIQQNATNIFLNLCGYERHFSRILVHAPVIYGGLGISQLYVESTCAKIELLICHINAQSTLGKIIQQNINWTQLHAGLSNNILSSTNSLHYITSTWFHPIKEFLNNINAHVEITGAWKPTKLRDKDIILMDEVTSLNISPDNLRTFNNWRMYFQVCTLSQITNMEGNVIQSSYSKKKECQTHISNSILRWPIQLMPSISIFHVWLNILNQILPFSVTGKLQEQLGCWIVKPLLHITTTHIIDKKGNNLYKK
jgi:hypothetical protein